MENTTNAYNATTSMIKNKDLPLNIAMELANLAQSKNPMDIANELSNALSRKGAKFVGLVTVTPLSGIAAAHKARNIVKIAYRNVTVAANYKASVERDVAKSTGDTIAFKVSKTYTVQSDDHADGILKHEKNGTLYLRCIQNHGSSVLYDMDNECFTTLAELESIMTKSAFKAATTPSTYNATNQVEHSVKVFNVKLENVAMMSYAREQVTL